MNNYFGMPMSGYPQNGYWGQNNPPMPDQLSQLRNNPMMPQGMPGDGTPTWVQGEAGAKAYWVPSGKTAVLWDSEDRIIYIKTTDQTGVPSMRKLRWVEEAAGTAPAASQIKTPDFVTRKEFDELVARLDEITKKEE